MTSDKTSFITLPELLERFGLIDDACLLVAEKYPFRITSFYAGLIKYPFDPLWIQSIPSTDELKDCLQPNDPLDETRLSPVPGVIHRYPDRAVLLASNRCAMYCRFCMRKRQVGRTDPGLCLDDAINYLAETPEIKDVLVSGGDPLVLEPDLLERILGSIRKIRHVEIIRIGSRVPVVAPSLITDELCRMLASHHPLYLNTHFNHPLEITPDSAAACTRLADAGIPLGNQTVLLKGVNDSADVLSSLFSGLLRIRVRPYYLHQMDLVKGTFHFRTPLSAGLGIINALRGKVSGMAIPHFCVDLQGGRGKVSLLPSAATEKGEGVWEIVAPDGKVVQYKDP